MAGSLSSTPTFASDGDFVDGATEAAARGIAHAADGRRGGEHVAHQGVKRGGIAFDGSVEADVLAFGEDRNSVIAEVTAEQDEVAGAGVGGGEVDAGADASDAGGVDENAVALALFDHLGIAGDDLDAGRFGGLAHGFGDAREHVDGEALFQNERGAEVERFGAAHGEIVDGAVDGERADIAAAEEERFDDEAVGGEGEALGADLEDGLIVEAAEDRDCGRRAGRRRAGGRR